MGSGGTERLMGTVDNYGRFGGTVGAGRHCGSLVDTVGTGGS